MIRLLLRLRFHLPRSDGTTITLSAGQAFNKMMGDPDPEVRAQLFAEWEKAWGEKEDLFADTLNHLDDSVSPITNCTV